MIKPYRRRARRVDRVTKARSGVSKISVRQQYVSVDHREDSSTQQTAACTIISPFTGASARDAVVVSPEAGN